MNEEPSGDSNKISPNRVRSSSAYRSALSQAAKAIKKPEKLAGLVDKAISKASHSSSGSIAKLRDNLSLLFRLLKAYANGAYREVAWSNLVIMVAAVIYFVMPMDLLPDFIFGLGFLDDAAIISWTIGAIGDELKKFARWEEAGIRKKTSDVEIADD